MKIIIDFDDVLFNTAEFKKKLIEVFENRGVPEKEFQYSYDECSKRIGDKLIRRDVYKQIDFLEKKLGINGQRLRRDLKLFLKDTSKFVFPDTKIFLECFKKEDLILLSFGGSNFEREKVMNSGIAPRFGQVVLTKKVKSLKSIEELAISASEIFIFVDDRSVHINNIKKEFPNCITILLKRKEGRYVGEKAAGADFEIDNLAKIKKIVERL